MLKRTPLYAAHQKLGGRLIQLGGWEMLVQYSSIIDDHLAVRKGAELFDMSHMGEVRVQGTGAAAFLNHLLTNDINKLSLGQGQYTLMCNERGGVIDHLYLYRILPEEYLLVINASRIEPDVAWMQRQLEQWPGHASVQLENISERCGAGALQGPRVAEVIDRWFPGPSKSGTQVTKASAFEKN